jgi:septum formation protein
VAFSVIPSHIPEEPLPGETPESHVRRLALGKAREVAASAPGSFFIGADTIVVCDGEIMGKPADEADAGRMLKKLAGQRHQVITGFAIYDRRTGRDVVEAVTTQVFFKPLTDVEIEAYVATGCPMDKAGAYAIQGGAAYMVQGIEGSYTNVVGLPLCEVVEALRGLGALT